MENSNFCVGCRLMLCFYYFTHGCKIIKAPMSMFCLATIYRQREISYKSVSDIPVCPRLAAKVWLVWSWPYQFLCILLHLAVTLPRGFQYPCTQRPHRATLTCQYWYSLAGIQPERQECLIASRNSALPELSSLYVHICVYS